MSSTIYPQLSTPYLLITTKQAGDPLADQQQVAFAVDTTLAVPLETFPQRQACVDEDGIESPCLSPSDPRGDGFWVGEGVSYLDPSLLHAEFDLSRLSVDSRTGELIYARDYGDGEIVPMNLSREALSIEDLMDFLEEFADMSSLQEMFEGLEQSPLIHDPVGRLVAQSETFSRLLKPIFRLVASLRSRACGPGSQQILLGGGCAIRFSQDGTHLFLEWDGLLPEGKTWRLRYDHHGSLVYTRGQMEHASIRRFPQVLHPEQLKPSGLVLENVRSAGEYERAVLSGVSSGVLDLAESLHVLGDPHEEREGGNRPRLRGESLGQFMDARALGQELSHIAEQETLFVSQLFMLRNKILAGDASLLLDFLQLSQLLSREMTPIVATQFNLTDGTAIKSLDMPQRLTITPAAGSSLPLAHSLHEVVEVLNRLQMQTRSVCHTLHVTDEGRLMVQIFVYNDHEREWQYFSRVSADRLGMLNLTPAEEDLGKIFARRGREHDVDGNQFEEFWNQNGPDELGEESIGWLRQARLLVAQPQERAVQEQIEFRHEVAPFLARVMLDDSGLVRGLKGREIFDGAVEPLLQYVIYTHSAEVAPLMEKFVRGEGLEAAEKIRLADRFQFVTFPQFGVGLGSDARLRDWMVALALRRARARAALQQARYEGEAGVFSVLLDLDPGRSGQRGSVPPLSTLRSRHPSAVSSSSIVREQFVK